MERTPTYLDADEVLEDVAVQGSFAMHPERHSVAMLARGKIIELSVFKGPGVELETEHQVYAMEYLADGRLLTVEVVGDDDSVDDAVVRIHPQFGAAHSPAKVSITFPHEFKLPTVTCAVCVARCMYM